VDERIFVALRFAAEKHKHHRRKGGRDIPYINHPIGVATLLATIGGVIAGLVAEVTDDPDLTSAQRKATQEREVPFKSPKAKLIRLADKTCNIYDIAHEPPPTWSNERRLAYFDWAERVVAGLRGVSGPLEAEFDLRLEQAREVVVR